MLHTRYYYRAAYVAILLKSLANVWLGVILGIMGCSILFGLGYSLAKPLVVCTTMYFMSMLWHRYFREYSVANAKRYLIRKIKRTEREREVLQIAETSRCQRLLTKAEYHFIIVMLFYNNLSLQIKRISNKQYEFMLESIRKKSVSK